MNTAIDNARRLIRVPDSLRAWGGPEFETTLKRELEAVAPGNLPLARATRTGYVEDSHLSLSVIHAAADGAVIHARIGVFFHEILAGCSCGDDPLLEPAYCELEIAIDRMSATVEVGSASPP